LLSNKGGRKGKKGTKKVFAEKDAKEKPLSEEEIKDQNDEAAEK
jgi:hypothetical protein